VTNFRDRIYRCYTRGHTSLALESIEELSPRAPYLRKVIREHFPVDRKAAILDLGCGHGAFIHFIREAGYINVVGVDRSPDQVAQAKRLGIDGVREGDLMEMLQTLPDASQDVVIAFDVVEHFTKEELLPFADEVHRVLRGHGRWIIHTANGESPFAGRIRYADFTHEVAFTRTSISQLLLSSGFAQVICQEDEPVPHGLRSVVRWVLWRMIRSGLQVYIAAETGAWNDGSIFSQNFLTLAVK
jgi:2-polyprenyl-3-methyl-5-hydroxy-6-metoxy-1,4-benzoquinol methylase